MDLDFLTHTPFWIALGQIIIIDILLGGDNAVVIALDRQEMATEKQPDGNTLDVPYSAVQYVRRQLGLQVCAIAKLGDLMQYLQETDGSAADAERVLAYRQRYGVDESE